ncbi:MAG TPA: hypothetical protein VGB77_22340 [Abditibacteriaceae bacterium]|jgi:hypothetical protein
MSQIIKVPEAANPEQATSKPPKKKQRHARLVDRILGGAPWLVAPHYRNNPDATKRFIANVRHELLDSKTRVLVCDGIAEFLREQQRQNPDQWDVTRDIPNTKPHADAMFWEWRNPEEESLYTGVLCKGVVKRSLLDAIAEFEEIQLQSFDYDVAMVLDSARHAATVLEQAQEAALTREVAMFLVGSVFQGELRPMANNKHRKKFCIRTIGSFAITMNASGRPIPDSLSLMTWDDEESAKDPDAEADWSAEGLRAELLEATRRVLLMHSLTRAVECEVTTVDADIEISRQGSPHTRSFAAYNQVELGTLPRKLVEEGFAGKEGLKQALVYMAFKFTTPPVEWRD